MHTGNSLNNARANLYWLGAGLVLCLFLHLAALSGKPGLHYDEAWAMNYSWRIASEPGFWPWRAMSPYTFPVAHYWAAGWMKAFGPSLFVFRLSQVVLSLGAIFLITYELLRAGFARAASFFPLVAALLPGLWLNHRFAIELNGVHPFLLAIMLSALLHGKPGRAGICWVVASMAHILFYGVGLGLVAACLWERRKFSGREYRALAVGAFALAVFFAHVLLSIPEKGKAAALLASALAIPVFTSPGIPLPRWRGAWLPWVLAAAFLFNLFFFAEGLWSLAIYTGYTPSLALFIEAFLFIGFIARISFSGARNLPPLLRSWFLFSLVVIGVMMLKPAPRYFELPLLAVAVALTFGLVQLPRRKFVLSLVFLFAHALPIAIILFTAAGSEKDLQVFLFKDSSRDFLNKQALAHFLGRNGCRLADIKSVDSRVREALLALSRADWPVEGSRCRWPGLSVKHLATEGYREGAAAGTEFVADFAVEANPE